MGGNGKDRVRLTIGRCFCSGDCGRSGCLRDGWDDIICGYGSGNVNSGGGIFLKRSNGIRDCCLGCRLKTEQKNTVRPFVSC